MSKLSNKNCDACIQKGVERKVRTLCEDCRKFLCKQCSDKHLLQKLFISHTLIDLDPPGEEPRPLNEDELASDFLKHVNVSENTVLYRAQVVLESTVKLNKDGKPIARKEVADISKLKPKKITEFSIKRPDDKGTVHLTGVLAINDRVILVDRVNMKLKLYDSSGNYQSSSDLKQATLGITSVEDNKFATCGYGDKVSLWTIKDQNIFLDEEWYGVDHEEYGIDFNKTYYCVLHCHHNAVTILDRQGRQVRKIVMKEAFGKRIKLGWDIHMDYDTHNIYVPCDPHNSGVLCLSVEGEALWFNTMPDVALRGITEIHGALCAANCRCGSLYLIFKTGQYIGKL